MTDRTPRFIRLETPHYLLRTLEPADATASWRATAGGKRKAKSVGADDKPVDVDVSIVAGT